MVVDFTAAMDTMEVDADIKVAVVVAMVAVVAATIMDTTMEAMDTMVEAVVTPISTKVVIIKIKAIKMKTRPAMTDTILTTHHAGQVHQEGQQQGNSGLCYNFGMTHGASIPNQALPSSYAGPGH